MKVVLSTLIIWLVWFNAHANTIIANSEGYKPRKAHTHVVIPHARGPKDPRNEYVIELIKLTLESTEADFGEWAIRFAADDNNNTQSRNLNMLASGNHDMNLIWIMTDKNKESLLKPIRIPIYKGIIGHRLCLLPPGQADMLKDIHSAEHFTNANITIGQGHDWPDTEILSSNGFNVTTSPNYDSLFKMLEKRQFDCFLRGLNEVFFELSVRPILELDYNLAFYYPSPAYFFVNSHNIALHARIQAGLERAHENGSFDTLFSRFHDESIQKLKLDSRTLIKLHNPLLSEQTPLDNSAYWYQDHSTTGSGSGSN